MTKKFSRIIAVIMLVIAVIFIGIALNNSQASFPWSNTITYTNVGVKAAEDNSHVIPLYYALVWNWTSGCSHTYIDNY